jgi:aldehyde:ferredoxin oxidoreductase
MQPEAKPAVADPAGYKEAQRDFNRALIDHPQTHVYRDYGTAAMAQMSNGFGGIPTRNFSSGQFEDVEAISGEHLRELLQARGGVSTPTHACMPGCTIRCSNVFGDQQNQIIVAPLEYETIGLMGSNLEISNLDEIAGGLAGQ